MIVETEKSQPTLDTLAQLARNPETDLLNKAKRKALTVLLSGKLIGLNNKNIQSYRNMYYCNNLLKQEEQELKTSYCKNRLCAVCGAIKTANLINGYLPELQKMEEPQFLTLTIKAVKGKFLKPAIDQMQRDVRIILKHLSKYTKLKITAIRKLECNFNEEMKTYNPHFHFVIDGLYEAAHIKNMWMDLNPRSNEKAQDITPADHNSMIELFKYATKIIGKKKDGKPYMNAKAIDRIFSALRNKRVIQPIGIKKIVDEDAREKVIYVGLEPASTLWEWSAEFFDWYNHDTGEALTQFEPDAELNMLFEQLRE